MSAVVEAREPSAKHLSAVESPLVRHFVLMATAPGGVARLRELILTLAVQGKLVPQDPKDEPASELLKKIRAEKDRLVLEGKIKRDKLLSEISEDEHRFEIPKTWTWARLGDLGQIVGGGTPKSDVAEFWAETGIPWLTPADLYGRRPMLISRGRRDVSPEGLASSSATLMPAGTVLFSSRAPIGYVAIAGASLATNQGFKSCIPHTDGLSEFLFWQLKQQGREIDAQASGTTFKEISGKDFGNVLISLAPLAEQSRITTRVEELMRLCDALEAKSQIEMAQHAQLVQTVLGALTTSTTPDELADNWQRVATHFDLLLDRPEAIDALEQTILQLAVRGLLVPQDPKDEPASELLKKIRAEKDRLIAGGKIKRDKTLPCIAEVEQSFVLPYGWAWARLQQAYDVRDGTHDTPKYQSTGYPLVTSKNIYGGVLDLSDVKLISPTDHQQISARSKVDRNDILFAMIGSIGNPVLVDTDIEFSVKNVALFKYYGASLSCPQYLLLVLQTEAVGMKARAAGGVQSFIALGQLRSTVVAMPPLAEQFRIVARVESLRRLCADLRQRLTTRQTTQAKLAQALIDEVA